MTNCRYTAQGEFLCPSGSDNVVEHFSYSELVRVHRGLPKVTDPKTKKQFYALREARKPEDAMRLNGFLGKEITQCEDVDGAIRCVVDRNPSKIVVPKGCNWCEEIYGPGKNDASIRCDCPGYPQADVALTNTMNPPRDKNVTTWKGAVVWTTPSNTIDSCFKKGSGVKLMQKDGVPKMGTAKGVGC